MNLRLSNLIIACLLIAGRTSDSHAQHTANSELGHGIGIEVISSLLFGETSYEMNALAPDPRNREDLVDIRSKLEFPLNTELIGVHLYVRPMARAQPRLSLSAEVLTNLSDPDKRMTNRDFVDGREVIYAESQSDLELWLAALAVQHSLWEGNGTSLSLKAKVEYERLEFYVVGLTGWQKSLFSENRVDISSDLPVLDYNVTYLSAQAGGEIARRLSERFHVSFAGTGGILFASDKDNHLQRSRIAEGQGAGVALEGLLQLRFLPGALFGVRLSGRAGAQIAYLYAEGHMDQKFADGKSYSGLPYTFRSYQPRVFFALGFVI